MSSVLYSVIATGRQAHRESVGVEGEQQMKADIALEDAIFFFHVAHRRVERPPVNLHQIHQVLESGHDHLTRRYSQIEEQHQRESQPTPGASPAVHVGIHGDATRTRTRITQGGK